MVAAASVMSLYTVNGKVLALDEAMEVHGQVIPSGNGIEYLYQTASALEYIHKKGYLHSCVTAFTDVFTM